MSSTIFVPEQQLVPIPFPYSEPKLEFRTLGSPRTENLTLIAGKTFLSTRMLGDITPPGAPDVGFFHDDTRFLSFMEMRVGGETPVLLSSHSENLLLSQIELTTSNIHLRETFDLPENTIHIHREQVLSKGALLERITFENFNLQTVKFRVEIQYDADFVDVFEVRGMRRSEHGQYYQGIAGERTLTFLYRGLDGVLRQTLISLVTSAEGDRKPDRRLGTRASLDGAGGVPRECHAQCGRGENDACSSRLQRADRYASRVGFLVARANYRL